MIINGCKQTLADSVYWGYFDAVCSQKHGLQIFKKVNEKFFFKTVHEISGQNQVDAILKLIKTGETFTRQIYCKVLSFPFSQFKSEKFEIEFYTYTPSKI